MASVSFIYSVKLALTCTSLQCALVHCLNRYCTCVNLQWPNFYKLLTFATYVVHVFLVSLWMGCFLFSEHSFPDSGHFVIFLPPCVCTLLFILASCWSPAHLLKQCFSKCGPRNTPASESAEVLVKMQTPELFHRHSDSVGVGAVQNPTAYPCCRLWCT